jgi:NADPH-dependent 2,4-dienoyl-CoA reductase/sulfur reductase-like enzyme
MIMTDRPTFVIVGGGMAGAKAAETLRTEGFDGRVVLLGEEAERPYERPPLSKGYLAGSAARADLDVHRADWYDAHGVELRLATRVVAVHARDREIESGAGERIPYDALLLATGSSPRRLRLPGGDLAGVHYLRVLQDADQLRRTLSDGNRRVVVVGGGWIGLETAAAAREYGNSVTIVEYQPTPLHAVLGPELGGMFADLHRDHGVRLRLGTGVSSFRGTGGQVTAVETTTGEELPADLVIVGVGIHPNVQLAESAGLTVDDGILVDAGLRSSVPGIYAAGDVANAYSPPLGRHLRVEHWANAKRGGPVAARSMLGQDVSQDRPPFFFTDQYDLGMEYVGYAAPGDFDRIAYRGQVAERKFVAFWLAGDRLVAGMHVNVWNATDSIEQLIRERVPVDLNRLTDPDVPLAELASAAAGERRP